MKNLKRTPIWIILLVAGISILIVISMKIITSDDTSRSIELNKYYLVLVFSLILIFSSILGTINSILSRENILKNITRAKIYSLIKSQPGIHFSLIVRTLQLGKGQTSWHLSHLKRYGLDK